MSEVQIERRELGEDRRARPPEHDRRQAQYDHPLNLLLTKVHEDVKTLSSDVRDLNGRLANHMKDETLELAEAVAALMVKSFPEGDPDGHRAYHEAQMDAAKDRAEFWKKMRFELSRAGLAGFLLWVGVQLWHGVLAGPSKS